VKLKSTCLLPVLDYAALAHSGLSVLGRLITGLAGEARGGSGKSAINFLSTTLAGSTHETN
jgi:hypothetical protein